MKFGRYLEENLTPEWRRAYIDYKGCKKRIKVVELRLKNRSPSISAKSPQVTGGGGSGNDSSDNDGDHGPAAPPKRATPSMRASSSRGTPQMTRGKDASPGNNTNYGSTILSPRSIHNSPSLPPPLDIGEPSVGQMARSPSKSRLSTVIFASGSDQKNSGTLSKSPDAILSEDERPELNTERERGPSGDSEGSRISEMNDPSTPLTGAMNPGGLARYPSRLVKSPRFTLNGVSGKGGGSGTSPNAAAVSSPKPKPKSIRSMTITSPFIPARSAPTFDELYAKLEPDEQAFFDFLDSELQKVESFFLARQADALRRGKELKDQLYELAEHRRLYHEFYPGSLPKWESTVERLLPGVGSAAAHATVTGVANAAQKLQQRFPLANGNGNGNGNGEDHKRAPSSVSQAEHGERARKSDYSERDKKQFSADRYTKYKHELRKATLEYYRTLEIIKNYRILNVTGFRKALKKFEKSTKIHCLERFTEEKITAEAFAKGEIIEKMLKDVEAMFTEHFEHGDTKKARDRLRKMDYVATHYTSVFRSGLMMGVGLPIAIISLVQAVQVISNDNVDSWNGLLQVYGGLYLPVIFALLFELNLDAFVSARINYEFVMELTRPVVDFRSYMEIPSFLFLTLSVCMYFSFFRIGAETVLPTTWPAAWLVFVAVFFLNPLPILRRRSRFWALRVLWRVITPGWSRVEFIAFFIADELNSLAYSLSNILFLSCAYANRWPDNLYTVCPSGAQWPYILVLAAPAMIRLIQCLKRYFDSMLKIHLINAGKYTTSVAQYAMFVWWRARGSRIPDSVFIGWIVIATLSSAYNCSWDFIVDWSLLRPGAGGLRKDRGYSSRNVYYFAMVTNFFIRFVFVWYLPQRASHTRLRSFFFALAEMLRRWQWNFFRVETEHLGNADAYRVTREIPLPYRRLDPDSDEEAEIAEESHSVMNRWNRIKKHFAHPRPGGKGPDALDVGPRGRRGTREYEARRPGDYDEDDVGGEGEGGGDPGPEVNGKSGGWDGLLSRIRRTQIGSRGSGDRSGSDTQV